MQVVSGLMIAAACFSVAMGIAWYARSRRGMADEYRRVAVLTCIFAFACGGNQVIDLLVPHFPVDWLGDVLEGVSALITLVAAALLWPRLSGLMTLPSSRELIAANRRLAAEERVRSGLVARLQRLNNELEQRVAERTAELAESKRRFEAALLGSNIVVAQQDRELRYTWVYNGPATMIGNLPADVLPRVTEQALEAAKRRVMETRQPERIEVSAPHERGVRWFDERIEPVVRGEEVVGVLCVAIDITSHKRYEQHLYSLLGELTHRSKNLLAVVQGLARQTAESAGTMREFNQRFAAQLQALSGAHELLVRRSWQGVDLNDLVHLELDTNMQSPSERVAVRGEREILGPEAAQNIALGLHELMTDALIHGALATPGGRVDISWDRITVDGSDLLELRWSESGSADPMEPQRRGFSRTLVERLVPRAIEGTSELLFVPEGLRWTLRFPISRLMLGN